MEKGRGWMMLYALTLAGMLAAVRLGSDAVTAVAEKMPMERQHCIVIDAGHGGVDGGAASVTGRPESGYNLEISLRLEAMLHLLGYDTAMIRREDVSVCTSGDTIAGKKISDLRERVRMVNSRENSVLLSIHQNHFSDSRYSGAQVFYGKQPGSEALAKAIQQSVRENLDPRNCRSAGKCTGVYLMEHIRCPGVLIECGFLSNPREEALLRNAEYQKKLCAVIATALDQKLRSP